MAEVCGYKRLTSSGTVGDAGRPIDIAGVSVLSGGTAAIPYFVNGANNNAGTDVSFRVGGTISTEVVSAIPLPVRLPAGCYVSFDANTTAVTVFYIQATTA